MTRFICDLIPQMDVWSPDHQVDPLERIKRLDGEKGVSNNHTVASVAVKGNLRFPLDISYHGCLSFLNCIATIQQSHYLPMRNKELNLIVKKEILSSKRLLAALA